MCVVNLDENEASSVVSLNVGDGDGNIMVVGERGF